MKILVLLIIMANVAALRAQNFKDDFDALINRVEQSEHCHVLSKVTVYESKKNRETIMSFAAEMKKNKDAYRSRMNDIELISNGDVMVMVDYEERTVQVEKAQQLSRSQQNFLNDFYSVDSLSKAQDSVLFVSEAENLITYKITTKKGMVESLLVVIDTKTNTLHRLEYEYRTSYYPTGNYVVIEYPVFDLNAEIDASVFNAGDVITKKGNDFYLQPKFKNYQLLNLYNRQ